VIKDIALSSDLKDPLAIAGVMMTDPNIPMLGCENALIIIRGGLANQYNGPK